MYKWMEKHADVIKLPAFEYLLNIQPRQVWLCFFAAPISATIRTQKDLRFFRKSFSTKSELNVFEVSKKEKS